MLKKIGGLARALYVILAIVAAFVALDMMNVPLVLVVLGLIAGLAMQADKMVLAAVTVVALPMVGTALGHIPAVGAQLTALCGNLQLGVAGAFATALAIFLYQTIMASMMGLAGGGSAGQARHTIHRHMVKPHRNRRRESAGNGHLKVAANGTELRAD